MRAPQLPTEPDALFGAQAIANPHALYARLRTEQPLTRVGDSGVHIVATWALVEEALGREEDFSANLTGVLVLGEEGAPSIFPLGVQGAGQVIATADEPEHAVHRALVQPRLAARRIAALEPELRRWVDDALDPLLAAGSGDFIPIAETVPARALARLLGLPGEDIAFFRRWAMMGGDLLAGAVDTERLGSLVLEMGRMVEYLTRHLEEASKAPQEGDDAPLLHALSRGIAAGLIDTEHALGISIVLFGAGGESTAALLGSAVRRLAEAPEIATSLRASPEQIPRFVEEVVRLEPPFKFHYRYVSRPCTLGGFQLEPGDRLMLVWASANRDADVYDEPDALRLDRRHPKQHLGFGRGSHFCVGAPLARMEARVLLERLLARTTELSITPGSTPRYAHTIFVRRLERLEIDAR